MLRLTFFHYFSAGKLKTPPDINVSSGFSTGNTILIEVCAERLRRTGELTIMRYLFGDDSTVAGNGVAIMSNEVII